MGEPRSLPEGVELYFGHGSMEVCQAQGVFKVVAGEEPGTLQISRPWAFFDDRIGYVQSYGVGPRGQRLAALECERGLCASELAGPTEDALLSLWVSDDAGLSWDYRGEIPQGTRIWEVTETDVALYDALEWDRLWRERNEETIAPHEGAWWYGSGEGVVPLDYFVVWVWNASEHRYGPEWFTPSGQRLHPPTVDDSAPEYPWWHPLGNLPNRILIWTKIGSPYGVPDWIVVQGEQGTTRAAYSWSDSSNGLHLTRDGVLSEKLLVGALGTPTCGSVMPPVLVDLEGGRVHRILGLHPPGYDEYVRLLAARPAPD